MRGRACPGQHAAREPAGARAGQRTVAPGGQADSRSGTAEEPIYPTAGPASPPEVGPERLYGLKRLERRPSEYLHDHAVWGFYEDRVGIELRHWLGVENIIWGGDFPHYPTRWPESRKLLARQMEGIANEERRKMLAQNLIDFLHLDAVAETPEL